MGLRVLVVVSDFPPNHSGTATVALNNSRELVKAGHDVTVVTPRKSESPQFDNIDGVRVRRLPSRIQVGNASLIQGLDEVGDFDLLHLHSPFILGGIQASRVAKSRGKPIIITYHQDLIKSGITGFAFNFYTRFVLQRLLASADAIVVPTLDYARQSKVSDVLFNAPRLVEIPNGVNVTRFSPGPVEATLPPPWLPEDGPRTFLFVGGLDAAHYFKGLDVLLKALARTPSKEAKLVVVGDGELRSHYEAMSEELGLQSRVYFAGRVSPGVLPDYYRTTACTVLPSVTQSEIFGIVLIEAMACGSPTIASSLPGVRTVVNHNRTGLLVPPGDVQALSEAMERILTSEVADEFGKAGREKAVSEYSWDRIGSDLDDLYREVVP